MEIQKQGFIRFFLSEKKLKLSPNEKFIIAFINIPAQEILFTETGRNLVYWCGLVMEHLNVLEDVLNFTSNLLCLELLYTCIFLIGNIETERILWGNLIIIVHFTLLVTNT